MLENDTLWGGGGEVLERNLGRGVQPTQGNPDPVQDKDVNFATLPRRKCCIFYPAGLDQALPFKQNNNNTKSVKICG